jgi:hypothetical protein
MGFFKLLEAINHLLVQKVSPVLSLDNVTPVDVTPHAHGPVLAAVKGPDSNFSPFLLGTFCSSPRFLSFSPKLNTLQQNKAHIWILHKQTFLMTSWYINKKCQKIVSKLFFITPTALCIAYFQLNFSALVYFSGPWEIILM